MNISLSLLKYIYQLCVAKFSVSVTFLGLVGEGGDGMGRTDTHTENMDRQTFLGKHYFRWHKPFFFRPLSAILLER